MPSFTASSLKELKPRKHAYRRMDSSRKGFGVQITPKGTIVFIFRYQSPVTGKDVPMKLGTYKDAGRNPDQMTLQTAREEWAKWKQVFESGLDPKIEQEREQRENIERVNAEQRQLQIENSRGTIEQLINAYVESLQENGKKSWEAVGKVLNKNVYIYVQRDKKARDVTTEDIKAVLSAITSRGSKTQAARVRAYLNAAFNYGIGWDDDPEKHHSPIKFAITINPVQKTKKGEQVKIRERVLSEDEIHQFWRVLSASGTTLKTRLIIQLLYVLGGQRVTEIINITADDVDFTERYVVLRNTKKGNDHLVPFGDMAIPLLQTAFAELGDTPFAGVDYHTINRAISRLIKREGLEHFVTKDARTTVKTLLGKRGVSLEMRHRYQNHQFAFQDAGTKHYDMYDYQREKRQVADTWEQFLTEIISGRETENKVIPLRNQA